MTSLHQFRRERLPLWTRRIDASLAQRAKNGVDAAVGAASLGNVDKVAGEGGVGKAEEGVEGVVGPFFEGDHGRRCGKRFRV